MAGSHGGCPFLVQMVWRHFSLELKRLGSTHNPVVSQPLLSKTSRPVVGVSTVQTLHLCLQDLLPTSAYRDILSIPKTCHLRQSIDKSPSTNDLTANMPKVKQKTHYPNQEYSSSTMPLTLHPQHTNLVITSEP